MQLLEELGALSTAAARSPKIGRRLARLPIDPRLAPDDPRGRAARLRARGDRDRRRAVAAGPARATGRAAGPGRPAARPVQGPRARDFLTWLNLWRYLKEQQRELSSSAFRRMCKREFLNYLRVREWQDFESQLRQVCKEMRDRDRAARRPARRRRHPPGPARRAALAHRRCSRSAIEGLGRSRGATPTREYLGARGARFAIFPGSGLHRKNPQFLMAGELVETSRLWARQNAAIKPEWAERLGAHLVKRTYSEPHWSQEARRGDGLRAGHAVRRAARRRPARRLRQGRPRARPRAVHPARAGLRRVARPGTASTTRTCELLEEAEELEHRARRRGHRRRRAHALRLLRRPGRRRGGQRRALRPVVEAGAPGRGPSCSPSTRRCSPTTPPSEVARGRLPASRGDSRRARG